MPADIVERFGQLGASAINDELLGFRVDDEEHIVAALTATGFTCVRDERTIDLATGAD